MRIAAERRLSGMSTSRVGAAVERESGPAGPDDSGRELEVERVGRTDCLTKRVGIVERHDEAGARGGGVSSGTQRRRRLGIAGRPSIDRRIDGRLSSSLAVRAVPNRYGGVVPWVGQLEAGVERRLRRPRDRPCPGTRRHQALAGADRGLPFQRSPPSGMLPSAPPRTIGLRIMPDGDRSPALAATSNCSADLVDRRRRARTAPWANVVSNPSASVECDTARSAGSGGTSSPGSDGGWRRAGRAAPARARRRAAR